MGELCVKLDLISVSLDVDLDAIAAAGKEEGKRKRILLIVFTVVIIVAAIIAALTYQHIQAVNRENTYQEALAAQEAGDYETAITLFQELKDYKDSIAQLSEAEFEQELTTSDVFAEWESLASEYIDTLLESGYYSGEYSYSAQERNGYDIDVSIRSGG